MEKLKSFIPVNWPLLSNPMNWVIVLLMLAIAGLAVSYVFNARKGAAVAPTEGN